MAARKRKIIPNSKIGSGTKLGMTEESFKRAYYDRKRILRIPPEIAAANPDKHFVFINMNKLQKSGMWHHMGYQLYRAESDSDSQISTKFNEHIDPYIHRNEMALAWIPKEEYQLRLLERDVARGKRDLKDIIVKDSQLKAFNAHASSTEEVFEYTKPLPKTGSQLSEVVQLGG